MCGNVETLFYKPRVAGVAITLPKEKKKVLDLGFDEESTRRIMKQTGIEELALAPIDKTTSDYCIEAANRLITELKIDKSTIDGVVIATPHPDYVHPGTCGVIQDKLNLRKDIVAVDINHACTGYVYGLFTAFLWIESGYCKNVLVCCGDTAAKHIHRKDRALSMVAGDGGSATIVTADGNDDASAFSFLYDGTKLKYLYTPAGGERMPVCEGKTNVDIEDDNGNIRTLEDQYMDGMEMMRFVRDETKIVIRDLLERKKWSVEDIGVAGFHQANELMVKTVARMFKIPIDKVPISIKYTGNIGGASIPLAICNNLFEGHKYDLKHSLLCGFGAGMSCAAMTVDLSKTYFAKVNEI